MKKHLTLSRLFVSAFSSIILATSTRAANLSFRNTLDDGTGAYAIATESLVPFDNTDSNPANNGFGLIGMMTLPNATIRTFWNAGNITAIQSAFQPFGTAFTFESTGLAGAFLDSRSSDTRASQNSFGGSPVYFWAYQGLSISTATGHLIAQLAVTFPTDPESGPPLDTAANLRPGEVTNLVVGGSGNFSEDYGGGSGPLPGFNVVETVPEPSTLAIGLLCLGVGLARRWRNGVRL